MIYLFRVHKYQVITFLAVLVLSALSLVFAEKMLTVDARQEQGKIVGKMKFPNEPLEVVDLKAMGIAVVVNQRFNGGEEWLRGISFNLKNTHHKTVRYASVYLEFPETQATGIIMSYQLHLGKRPGKRTPASETSKDISITAGSVENLTLSDDEYARLKKFIESRQPISSISRVTISVPLVYFSDGTAWSAGTFFQPDSNAPRRMHAVNAP